MNTTTREIFSHFDQKHIWHPYASMAHAPASFLIDSAHGATLTLADQRTLVDGMSSWWTAIHGYNHPVLNRAICQQTEKMAHVMFGGLTHQPAITLAETLLSITPDNLQHIFYTDSGSVAVEVAMKMALQYAQAQGQPQKQRFLSLFNGYHGDTFGTMSICDPVNGMHHLFRHMLPQQIFSPAPPNVSENKPTNEAITAFRSLVDQHQHEIAAVILEPIVQNAGGMRIYEPSYLSAVREITLAYDIPLIVDEIATGFGRTGKLFACEHAAIKPDIMCIGKALTGGYVSLAATLTTTKISQTISDATPGVLMHGPTFMANPLACAVAQASTQLLLESPWQERVMRIESQLHSGLDPCRQLSMVADVRVIGAIGVVELVSPIDVSRIQTKFIDEGVWIRPFGKLMYIMPAYIISDEQLSTLCSAIFDVISTMEQA